MLPSSEFVQRLEEAMRDESRIIVPEGAEPAAYYEALRNSIRAAACEPLLVRAVITGEDFPDELQGHEVAAYVLAASEGYWLAYQPESGRFYCFWGSDTTRLGAHREAGSPLFVWWN
jgi:hypothetical protein